jgi:hypothetical protein
MLLKMFSFLFYETGHHNEEVNSTAPFPQVVLTGLIKAREVLLKKDHYG